MQSIVVRSRLKFEMASKYLPDRFHWLLDVGAFFVYKKVFAIPIGDDGSGSADALIKASKWPEIIRIWDVSF